MILIVPSYRKADGWTTGCFTTASFIADKASIKLAVNRAISRFVVCCSESDDLRAAERRGVGRTESLFFAFYCFGKKKLGMCR